MLLGRWLGWPRGRRLGHRGHCPSGCRFLLHLVAAAAWVGTLLPLALVLAAAGRDAVSVAIARTATVRFSAFGIASVGTLLVIGIYQYLVSRG